MIKQDIKQDLITLKLHADHLCSSLYQLNSMIYSLEEKLIDKQEQEWFEKFNKNCSIFF